MISNCNLQCPSTPFPTRSIVVAIVSRPTMTTTGRHAVHKDNSLFHSQATLVVLNFMKTVSIDAAEAQLCNEKEEEEAKKQILLKTWPVRRVVVGIGLATQHTSTSHRNCSHIRHKGKSTVMAIGNRNKSNNSNNKMKCSYFGAVAVGNARFAFRKENIRSASLLMAVDRTQSVGRLELE